VHRVLRFFHVYPLNVATDCFIILDKVFWHNLLFYDCSHYFYKLESHTMSERPWHEHAIIYATADEADAYMFHRCFFVFFVFFRPPQNTRQPFSGMGERIFMKLLTNDTGENGVSNVVPKWGLGPKPNFLEAKNWKINKNRDPVATVLSLWLPEWKRISEGLKRLWNHETVAYKVYVRPWPLTPRGKHSVRFCMYKCKNFRFLAILYKFSAVIPHQTFTVNSPRDDLQIWKILWTLNHKRLWTIWLKNPFLHYELFVYRTMLCSSIRTGASA